MTDRVKISELTALTNVAQDDQIVVLDVSDLTESPEGTTKRADKSELKGLNWQGAWSAGSYLTDDAVEHNGTSYVANADTTEEPSVSATDWDVLAEKGEQGDQGIQGIQGDQGVPGMNWQGNWSAGEYVIDDVVYHNGSSWIATTTTTQEPSDSATDWDIVAERGNDGDMARSTYDPTNVNDDAFAMDNMTEGTDTKILTAAERAKLAYISLTQAVDLDQMESDIAALANGMVYKGNWDASAGSFPGAGVAQTGWFYTVSVAGTVDGVVFNIGDRLISIADNASATTYASNWTQLDATDAVTSVAGLTGNVSDSGLRTALNVGEIIDEDNMASDSATKTPSQQSVKAFVLANAGGGTAFGDGHDGDVIISTNTTLTEDKYYKSLTINSGIILDTGGYRIYVSGTLTNEGTIRNNGGNANPGTNATGFGDAGRGKGGTGGAGAVGGTLDAAPAGKTGGNGRVIGFTSDNAGVAGTSVNPSVGVNGPAGASGGSGDGTSPGPGGALGTATSEVLNFSPFQSYPEAITANTPELFLNLCRFHGATSGLSLSTSAGSGSGGGGSGGENGVGGGGGGSGGTGGIVWILAKNLVNNGTIQANGGNGGNGGNGYTASSPGGGGGGGSGGSGGVIVLGYETITVGTIQASGGTGGTGGFGTSGNSGGNGATGTTGNIYRIQLSGVLS